MAHTENGSIIELSSDNLLTEDLIAIKFTRYFYIIYFIDFSDIKFCIEHALLLLILHFAIKNQLHHWSLNIGEILKFPSFLNILMTLAFAFMYHPTEMCICNCLSHFYSFIKPE